MTKIIINDCSYKTRPIYNLYAGSEDGRIIHIVKQKPNFGKKSNNGYMIFTVRKFGESGRKNYQVHRFIYECYYGLIPNDRMQIDHINDVKDDNRLCNLQLLSHSENCKKSYKNRKHFNNHENRKCVKATNEVRREVKYYFSISSAGHHIKINYRSIQMVCEGLTKTALSKKDNCQYTFKYIKDDLPVNYIKTRIKKTPEQIKERVRNYQTKDWICPYCDKVYRNHYKYRHRKICK